MRSKGRGLPFEASLHYTGSYRATWATETGEEEVRGGSKADNRGVSSASIFRRKDHKLGGGRNTVAQL